MNHTTYQQEHKLTLFKKKKRRDKGRFDSRLSLKPPLFFFLTFPHWWMIQQVCQLDSNHFRDSSSKPLRVIILSLMTHSDWWLVFFRWNIYPWWKTRAMRSPRALPRHTAHANMLFSSAHQRCSQVSHPGGARAVPYLAPATETP